MSDFGAQAPGLTPQDPVAAPPQKPLTMPWQERQADLDEVADFRDAFELRSMEVMARNQGASPQELRSLLGDQWAMLAFQKHKAEQLGLDSNRFWQGTDILNEQLVEDRWMTTMADRFALTEARLQDPEIAQKIDNLKIAYQGLLAKHEFGKKHYLQSLQDTDNPYVREQLMKSIFPIVSDEEWRGWQRDIFDVNEAMEEVRSGINLFNHPDTAAMAKGLMATINHRDGGFLQKEKPKREPRFGSETFEAIAQPIEAFGDAAVGGIGYGALKMIRLTAQMGLDIRAWATGEERMELNDFENAFSYTLDEQGNPVYVGGSFGSAELVGTLLGAMGFEQAGIKLAAKGRSQREIADTWEDETLQGIVNSGAAAIGAIAGFHKMFMKAPIQTGAAVRGALQGGGAQAKALSYALEGQEMLARSTAWLAGGSTLAKGIRKGMEITAAGGHAALLAGMATGEYEKFGRAATAGFWMMPVNMMLGVAGDKVDAWLLGGSLKGPIWNTGVRMIRGLFEGAGFGLFGAATGIPIEPIFDKGSPENQLLENFLKNPNAENSKAFFSYMAEWTFGNMIGQAVFGRASQRQAVEGFQRQEMIGQIKRERDLSTMGFVRSAAGDQVYAKEFEKVFGPEARRMGEAGQQKAQEARLRLKIKKGEDIAPEDMRAAIELMNEEKRGPILRALGALADIFKSEAEVITAAEKKGYRYQPLVDILEAGGGRLNVSEEGQVSIHVNDNLMLRLIRNRIRKMTRYTERITEGERIGEVKGADEIGLMVSRDPKGGWDIRPMKGHQGGVSGAGIYGAYDDVAMAQGLRDRSDLDKTQITLIHSHPFATPFSDADLGHFIETNWSMDAPAGGEYAPQIQINAEGGYAVRPKGDKSPGVIGPWADPFTHKTIGYELIDKGMRGELGEVMRKYLNTRYEGDANNAKYDFNRVMEDFSADKQMGVADRPMFALVTQASHIMHKQWADKHGFEYGYFEPKAMAKAWDDYMQTGKFSFEGAKDPLEHLMMVGSEVEKRLAADRLTPKDMPPPKQDPRPPVPPSTVKGPETLEQVEQRLRDWMTALPEGAHARAEAGRVMQKVKGEHYDSRRRRLLAYIDSTQPQPQAEAVVPVEGQRIETMTRTPTQQELTEQAKLEAEPTEERGTFEEQEPAAYRPGEPDYVKLWESLKPREGESIEDRHARIQAEIDKATPPPPKQPRMPPSGFFRAPPEPGGVEMAKPPDPDEMPPFRDQPGETEEKRTQRWLEWKQQNKEAYERRMVMEAEIDGAMAGRPIGWPAINPRTATWENQLKFWARESVRENPPPDDLLEEIFDNLRVEGSRIGYNEQAFKTIKGRAMAAGRLPPPPPEMPRDPGLRMQKPPPSNEEMAEAGRNEVAMAKPGATPTPGPTIAEQRTALKKGFEQQRTYWDSAQVFNQYVKKIVASVTNFNKRYWTDKEYRKELAHRIRHSVGYGAKFLVLGPDHDHVKAQTDMMRQSVSVASKNARVLRNRIFREILEDQSLKPEQRQELMDEVLQYGVLRDLEANYLRPLKETVLVDDMDPATGKPTGKKVPYTVLRRVPRELPFGVTVQAVTAERKEIEARLTPAQRAAYVNIRAHLDAAWDTMVARGIVTDAVKLTDYFPHKILDWSEADHPALGTTLPKQRPVRPYLMGRQGSRRMFDTSIRAIQDYLVKVDVQNAKHDFLDTTARNIHLRALREHGMEHVQWDELTPDQWRDTMAYMEGEGFVLFDTRYGRTGKETLERDQVVQNILADIEVAAGIPITPEVVVGRNYRPNEDKGVYFVTKEYAEFIRAQFASTAWQYKKLRAANRMIGRWIKAPMLRGLLGTKGPRRALRNLASDLNGIYMKGDGLAAVMGTLRNLPAAKRIIHAYRMGNIDQKLVSKLSDYELSILQEMEARGTLQANVRGQEWTRDDPIEVEWMNKTLPEVKMNLGRMLSKMYRADFKWASALDDYSENLLRVAYFMRERMERFKVLKQKGVGEDEGVHQLSADFAHLRTGEVLVNYNHLTPLERHGLNGIMTVFYTWAKSNFFEMAAVSVERPLTTAMRAAIYSAPFIAWNMLFAAEEEELLWNKDPRLAAKPHLIFPFIRDSFGNPMVFAWDSTMGEALGFLGLDQLPSDTMQFLTGHGDADILAKDFFPGAFENMTRKWTNFTAPWIRAIGAQMFSSEFVTTGERVEQFLETDLPQLSRPWSDLQSFLQLNRQERSPESRWVDFAPFIGYADVFEGIHGEALPQHFMAGRLQRRESQLSQAIGNNMRRFTSGIKDNNVDMMTEAVQRVWDDMGDDLTEMGIEPVHLISRFIDRAINQLSREELLEMGLTPKWLQLSASQQAVLLLQLMERNK